MNSVDFRGFAAGLKSIVKSYITKKEKTNLRTVQIVCRLWVKCESNVVMRSVDFDEERFCRLKNTGKKNYLKKEKVTDSVDRR